MSSTRVETHRFEAEVQRVLELVIHSLYTRREVFLRELISNASDALDKLRFEALTRPELLSEGESLGIVIEVDQAQRILRVGDNGIGMDREELVENLGRIASSGTRRFLEALEVRRRAAREADGGQAGEAEGPDLIGQFGVGFYSAFTVADAITVETRHAGDTTGWRWSARGEGEYTIEEAEGLARGTVVSLHLRTAQDEEERRELDELLQERRIREVVRRYSDFVEYPIQMEVEAHAEEGGEEPRDSGAAESESKRRIETLNSMKPLWARPKDEIEAREYEDFYRHLTHDWNAPLRTIHFKAEGSLEYTALLYLPKQRPLDLFDPGRNKSCVSLYVRRVLIMRECEELLPTWLRFVRGVVESADLPLNVSRETLQDNPRVRPIRKRLVRKVLEDMSELLADDRAAYEEFWSAFGPILKEGLYYGEDEDGRLARCALFWSTRPEGKPGSETREAWTTLAEYVERMPVSQKEIYTLCGPDRATLERSPHLEALREKRREVLLLTDPVDEWVLQRFHEFEGKALRAVERGDFDLGDESDKQRREAEQKGLGELLGALGAALAEEGISEVRFSTRLKDSPAVLVSAEHGPSAHLARILRHSGQPVPEAKRILELNPGHALITGLKRLHAVDPGSPRLTEYARLLHGQALLREGSPLPDPAAFSRLVTELMVGAVSS